MQGSASIYPSQPTPSQPSSEKGAGSLQLNAYLLGTNLNLRKQNVLNELWAEFGSNALYVIFGPSGSGKTTLMNIIAGLDKPDEGHHARNVGQICHFKV